MAREKLIRLRIDEATKDKAEAILNRKGVTVNTVIRMMIHSIADTGKTPFDDAFTHQSH